MATTTKPKKIRLTATQKILLDRISGQNVTINLERSNGETTITLSDGSRVVPSTFQSLLKKGVLIAVGDGMFGDSQSYGFSTLLS